MEYPSHQAAGQNMHIQTAPSDLIPQASPTHSSSSSEEQSPKSKVPSRRKSLPNPRANRSPTSKINTAHPISRGTKSMSAGVRERSSQGSLMNMTGALGVTSEITYTPTTHRISKAKKGKKVHACEYPGCSKIFTRAEHRKRHEANHNSVPLYQCEVDGCRKPFQRADLLQRHMERQHNAPVESPLNPGHPANSSAGDISYGSGSPSRGNILQSSLGPSPSLPSQPISNSTGTMSIGSIIEPPMRHDFVTSAMHTFADYSHLPVPAAPRMPPDLMYSMPASDSPYSPHCSSDSSYSSYSPLSDLIQPHIASHPYQSPDDMPRAQSASFESAFPQQLYTSPLTGTSPLPTWNFDQPPLSAPMQGSMQASMLPTSRRLQYEFPNVPTFMDTNGMTYDINVPLQQAWPPRKMTL